MCYILSIRPPKWSDSFPPPIQRPLTNVRFGRNHFACDAVPSLYSLLSKIVKLHLMPSNVLFWIACNGRPSCSYLLLPCPHWLQETSFYTHDHFSRPTWSSTQWFMHLLSSSEMDSFISPPPFRPTLNVSLVRYHIVPSSVPSLCSWLPNLIVISFIMPSLLFEMPALIVHPTSPRTSASCPIGYTSSPFSVGKRRLHTTYQL